MPALRVALVGAFCFPAPQGSQVFARDQARALARAGAGVRLESYGRGVGDAPDGVALGRIPAFLAPRSYRSGPTPRKPLGDAALVMQLRRSAREQPVDAVLAHNAEAAVLALAAGVAPTLYVAHTLVEEELSAYVPAALAGPLSPSLASLGRAIDRALARRAAAVVALSSAAAERLRRDARGPIEIVPPGVERRPPPPPAAQAAACARHGLVPGDFALYAGNLDAYQEIGTLREIATRLPDRVVAVATHARPRRPLSPLRVIVASPEEVRVLTHAAAVAVATRRRCGGFPIKLLNYLEAGRAIVAREGQACTLTHDVDALLLPADADAEAFAEAIESLFRDPARAARLGRRARATADREHDWDAIGRRTLALVERIVQGDRAQPDVPGVPREPASPAETVRRADRTAARS